MNSTLTLCRNITTCFTPSVRHLTLTAPCLKRTRKHRVDNPIKDRMKYGKLPFNPKFPIVPKDVSSSKKWGSKEVCEELGHRDDMPQMPGYIDENGEFVFVKEMVPEFVVPDLTNCKLKPYVSYRVIDVHQSELTAKDLFAECYAKDIIKDFHSGNVEISDIENKYIKQKGKSTD